MYTVALFGEAQKGEFHSAYYCKSVAQLSDFLGEPPSSGGQGLFFAIQTLLYSHNVIFFRVHEEGFSLHDYHCGLNYLATRNDFPKITALCLPGVGNEEIISETLSVCELHKSILMITEKDLYDYFTNNIVE